MEKTTSIMQSSALPQIESELRKLDGIEEFFWLAEQRLSKAPVLVAQLEGVRSESKWRDAVGRLQKVHPLLSVHIHKTRGKRPVYIRSDKPLELTIYELTQDLSLEREMEKALHKSFGDGSGVPLRIHLYQGFKRSIILLSYHHAMLDGITGLLVLRDLLTLVSGGEIAMSYQLEPGYADYVHLSNEWTYTSVIPEEIPGNAGAELATEANELRVHCLLLEADLTRKITQHAHSHGVTVHGVLVGALALAAFHCSPMWQAAPNLIVTPVNPRTVLNLPDVPGLLVYMIPTLLEHLGSSTIWDVAKQMREEVTRGRSLAGAVAGYQGILHFLTQERTPKEIYDLVREVSGNMMVSNYGADKIPCRYGDLRLRAVYCGSSAGSPTHQKVDVLTLDGRLSMTVVTQRPIDGLLEKAACILRTALLATSNNSDVNKAN